MDPIKQLETNRNIPDMLYTPLCVVMYAIRWATGVCAQVFAVPSELMRWYHIRQDKQTFINSGWLYVEPKMYYKKKIAWREEIPKEIRQYKDYIHVMIDGEMVKAQLHIHKVTTQLAYVYNGQVVCEGKDIEQYRLTNKKEEKDCLARRDSEENHEIQQLYSMS